MIPESFERIARRAPFHDEGYGFDLFGMHPADVARAVESARPIYERYFRVDSIGAERIPARGPTILVANHAGALPVDAAILCLDVLRRADPPRIPRPISDRFVPRLPIVSTLFARLGVVNGTRANVDCLLERGELVAIWPEGVTGVGKSFRDRYTIQSWRVGFAELALRHGATIQPVAIVGSEESWPILGKLPRVRAFGAPYIPLPAWPVPLPVRYRVRYGAPIRVEQDLAKARKSAPVDQLALEVRSALEALIADALAARRGLFR